MKLEDNDDGSKLKLTQFHSKVISVVLFNLFINFKLHLVRLISMFKVGQHINNICKFVEGTLHV